MPPRTPPLRWLYLCLLYASFLNGQQPGAGPRVGALSLAECIDYALAHQPALRAAREELQLTALDNRIAVSAAEFEQTMNQFLGAINGREEITGAFSFFTAQAPNYELKVDRIRAKQLGVPLQNIYTTLQTYLGSRYINDFTLYGRTFRVVAQADTAYRAEISHLFRPGTV